MHMNWGEEGVYNYHYQIPYVCETCIIVISGPKVKPATVLHSVVDKLGHRSVMGQYKPYETEAAFPRAPYFIGLLLGLNHLLCTSLALDNSDK